MMTINTFRAEWTKLLTVRGWRAGLVIAVLVTVVFGYLVGNGANSGICTRSSNGQEQCGVGHPFVPTGPDGEAVADSYYLVGTELTGNGTITARVTSLTGVTSTAPANAAPSMSRTRPGVVSWAKTGLIISASAGKGSAYAAVMATPGHGVRFQYDYTHDAAGRPGALSRSAPRWLRLTRAGDRVTASDSTNGSTWHGLGTADLTGLRNTVTIGMFTTSPVTYAGLATSATGTLDRVTLTGSITPTGWAGDAIGETNGQFYSVLGSGGYSRRGGQFTIRGSGDIAPAVTAAGDTAATILLQALVVALLVIVILAATFITTEYRRGLIRTTLTAMPNRGAVIAAKALVIGIAVFIAGTIAALITVPLGDHLLTSNGNYVLPSSAVTTARVVLGTGALLALSAVAVLAGGGLVRRTSGTVIAGIVLFVLPVIIAVPYTSSGQSGSSPAWVEWLLRVSPAAALSVVTSLPRSPLVSYPYKLSDGYLPLSPAAGLTVLGAWAAVLLALAIMRIQRSDG